MMFDDGGAASCTRVPTMEPYGPTAAVYVVAAPVRTVATGTDLQGLAPAEATPRDAEEIREPHTAAGTIGSHSIRLRDLPTCPSRRRCAP